MDRNFTVTEELITVSSMHGTTKDVDIFEEVVKSVEHC
jgi:hypothetical protein